MKAKFLAWVGAILLGGASVACQNTAVPTPAPSLGVNFARQGLLRGVALGDAIEYHNLEVRLSAEPSDIAEVASLGRDGRAEFFASFPIGVALTVTLEVTRRGQAQPILVLQKAITFEDRDGQRLSFRRSDEVSALDTDNDGMSDFDEIFDGRNPDEDSRCAVSCNANETCCGGTCVNLLESPTHCGFCQRACEISRVCIDGGCSNERPPVFRSSTTASSAENNPVGFYTAFAEDPDDDSVTYSVSGGADGRSFKIDADSGVLAFISPPDFEAPSDADENNIYLVQLRATDPAGAFGTIDVIVNVSNQTSAFATRANLEHPENQTTLDFAFPAVHSETGEPVLYEVAQTLDGGRFAFDNQTRRVEFSTSPNFEQPTDANSNNDYVVELTARDERDATDTWSVTVSLGDVNEAPMLTALADLEIVEGTRGTLVTVEFGDPDTNDTVTLALAGPDADRFSLDPNSGVLQLNEVPDFERPVDTDEDGRYEVEIRVRDQGGLERSQSLSVRILDVPSPPPMQEFSTDGDIEALEVADMTGDGAEDVVAVVYGAGRPRLLLFPGRELNTPSLVDEGMYYTRQLILDDLDGDGRRDIILRDSTEISVYAQATDGDFASPFTPEVRALRHLVIGNLNKDSIPDFFGPHGTGVSFGIQTGDQNRRGTFDFKSDFTRDVMHYGREERVKTSGDLDRDGLPEFYRSQNREIYKIEAVGANGIWNGSGFVETSLLNVKSEFSSQILDFEVADFDSDRVPDAVLLRQDGQVYLGKTPISEPSASDPVNIEVQDLDRDGAIDIVVGYEKQLVFFFGVAPYTLGFRAALTLQLPHEIERALLADLNADGVKDVVAVRKQGFDVLYATDWSKPEAMIDENP